LQRINEKDPLAWSNSGPSIKQPFNLQTLKDETHIMHLKIKIKQKIKNKLNIINILFMSPSNLKNGVLDGYTHI
jgi:hypothetical protein